MLLQSEALRIPLAAQSVHCAVTSPPYFSLRVYEGDQGRAWPAVSYAPMPGLPPVDVPAMKAALGGESTIEAYIGHMVLAAREVWRVLRDDGTFWLNVGDSYGSGEVGRHDSVQGRSINGSPVSSKATKRQQMTMQKTVKPKNLLFIPARLALALQADGWYVRNMLPWVKRNPMPESVTDRLPSAVEYVFLLAKSERYYFDFAAVQRPAAVSSIGRQQRGVSENHKTLDGAPGQTPHTMNQPRQHDANRAVEPLRRWRAEDVFYDSLSGLIGNGDPLAFLVNTNGYAGAHFATFPVALVEPCIKAGTSEHGVCPRCGSPYVRVMEREGQTKREALNERGISEYYRTNGNGLNYAGGHNLPERTVTTTGWQPTCTCDAGDPVPATVLDPFSGAGTTVMVARNLGRRGVGLDLSYAYSRMAQQRTTTAFGALTNVHAGDAKQDAPPLMDLPLFTYKETVPHEP